MLLAIPVKPVFLLVLQFLLDGLVFVTLFA